MIGAYTWQQTGLNLMLFLVGLQGLPPELWVNLGDDGLREAAYRGG